jgi:non-heme Fe2+,alpha-ketoglutarate-dependent halogenase
MPKLLTPNQVKAYKQDGLLFPIKVMEQTDAQALQNRLELYENQSGGPIQKEWRHKVHLLFTWANEIVRNPKILDAVEDLIGPNIICWTTNFFIKEANDPSFVSWHQDSTYWGLNPADVVTAWFAMSDAPIESGAMKFILGSHKWGQMDHVDTFDNNNLLTRGQEIAINVNGEEGVYAPLKAGEISLHHIKSAHGSAPNTTNYRRIGLAIRYIPTYVEQLKIRDSAMLVRGTDIYGNFDLELEPTDDLSFQALAAHKDATERQLKTYYEGTTKNEFRP